MKLDFRPRCKCCNKIPRGKMRMAEWERYKPFCSYHCQEIYNMRQNLAYCASLRNKETSNE